MSRTAPSAPAGGGTTAAAPAAAPITLGQLLDSSQFATRQAFTPSPVNSGALTAVIDQITRLGATQVSAGAWEALGSLYASTNGVGRSQIAAQLASLGLEAEAGSDGRYVTFANASADVGGTFFATCDTSSNQLRVTNGNSASCFQGTGLVQSLTYSGNSVKVETSQGEQVWDALSGNGTQDGFTIESRPTPVDPNEPARGPWLTADVDALREPSWSSQVPLASYGQEYDLAVAAMGGQVLESSQTGESPAEQFNCHSFSTTGGEGDLMDPFSRTGYPHWINNPMHELQTGPYTKLDDSQRAHPGDIVVYRDNGVVTHTAVVRQVDANGNPSVMESKFGALGLYMHDPFDVPPDYGQPADVFRPNAQPPTA